jgi:hypothetical protein
MNRFLRLNKAQNHHPVYVRVDMIQAFERVPDGCGDLITRVFFTNRTHTDVDETCEEIQRLVRGVRI